MTYDSAFESVLSPRCGKKGNKINRGSMHVIDLWGDKNLQEIMGSLPFPKDRLKILNSYQQGKDPRLKPIKNKRHQKGKENLVKLV